jgi:hypothetical protein
MHSLNLKIILAALEVAVRSPDDFREASEYVATVWRDLDDVQLADELRAALAVLSPRTEKRGNLNGPGCQTVRS